MSNEYNYRVTNTSDEIQYMDDDGLRRRFNPGQSQKTMEKPDGRETWYELEKLNPSAEDIEHTADLPEKEEEEEEEEESGDEN